MSEEIDLEKLIQEKRIEFGIAPVSIQKASEVEGRPVPSPRQELALLQTARPKPDPRPEMWASLVKARGKRYESCRFENFYVVDHRQKSAIDRLQNFGKNIECNVNAGNGVILFGSKGTGKDHLMMGLAFIAVRAGKKVTWLNGADMRGDVRDSTKGDELERDYVKNLLRPEVLWISDPLPVSGALTDAQQDRLFRVLDARYSNMRPTWVTVNASDRTSLEERIGPQNADRLRDGSLAVFCDWPSYREVLKT